MIRDYMQPYFEQHPELRSTIPLPTNITIRQEPAKQERYGIPDFQVTLQLFKLINNPRFTVAFQERLEKAKNGDLQTVIQFLIRSVRKTSSDSTTIEGNTRYLLDYIANTPVMQPYAGLFDLLQFELIDTFNPKEEPPHAP